MTARVSAAEVKQRARVGSRHFTPQHLMLTVAMIIAGVAATWQAWVDIFRTASIDEESNHVFLVPLVVVWLVWMRIGRWRQCRPVNRWIGPALIALGWAIWSSGYRIDKPSMWYGGAVMIVVGCMLTVLGTDVLVKFMAAFGALVFIMPLPTMFRQLIAVRMQTVTADITHVVCQVLGMAVERSGALLTYNGVPVAIAEACNGMRMVFTLVLVCYTFAFVSPLKPWVRTLILVASPITAMACNIVRLVPTVWVYGHYSPETAATFHDISGWAMLVLAFLLLTGIVRVLRWAFVPVSPFALVQA